MHRPNPGFHKSVKQLDFRNYDIKFSWKRLKSLLKWLPDIIQMKQDDLYFVEYIKAETCSEVHFLGNPC